MAAGPLTITARREQLVNFVTPFQHLGLTVIVKRPVVTVTKINVLQPFDLAVWALILLSIVLVSNSFEHRRAWSSVSK